MVYSVNEVAQFVLSICSQINRPISNLKLQKLLYYIQGYSLAKKNEKMFNSDICAWQYGPVVPEAYDLYKIYAASPIETYSDIRLQECDEKIVIDAIKDKIDLPVWDLVEKTHEEDPWKFVYQVYGDKSIIPCEFIEEYFNSILK